MKKIFMAALLLLPASAGAREASLALDGKAAGCPMKLVYDPALLKIDPQGALASGGPELVDLIEGIGLDGIGRFKEPRSGRTWYLYSTLGASCDPYFLFISSGPEGREQAEAYGETLRLTTAGGFSVRQAFGLYFPIVRSFVWENGRPAEKTPEFYPVKMATKTLKRTDLFPGKDAAAAREWLPAGAPLTVLGYCPACASPRALVLAGGKKGWVQVEEGVLAGVAFLGD
ncbi:MAG: hypothetical protein Q7R35_01815 [Elusimicrobiota bacterium]|nr:hypothetical protein [Elusimicrobiota bacterium]